MRCVSLELPKHFSSSTELTLYVKKLLGIKKVKKRTIYRVGRGKHLKKVLVAEDVRVEIVYETDSDGQVTVHSALVCRP